MYICIQFELVNDSSPFLLCDSLGTRLGFTYIFECDKVLPWGHNNCISPTYICPNYLTTHAART